MSYENKIASARSILEAHNLKAIVKVDVDKFFNNLVDNGATSESALSICTYEDLKSFGAPLILAKQIANTIFRIPSDGINKASGTQINRPTYYNDKHAIRMSIEELVTAYDPTESDNAVAKRLKEISKHSPCVVFKGTGNEVDVVATVKLVKELKDNFPPRNSYSDDANPVPREIYPIGERPNNMVDVNPIFVNEVLRPGGECVNINRSWDSVPLETKQLIYLGRQNGELKVDDLRSAISIHADAITDHGFSKIAAYAPKAALEFQRLLGQDSLPKMKVSRNNRVGNANDPFYSGHKKY